MKHDKGLLKADKLAAFREWLVAAGFEVRDGKGEFQCLQVKTSPTCWSVVGRNAVGTLSTHPDLRTLINRFNSGKPWLETVSAAAPVEAAAPDQFLDDLRDDFAMHALQGLLSWPGDEASGSYHSNSDPAHTASMAYEYADAMMTARKACP